MKVTFTAISANSISVTSNCVANQTVAAIIAARTPLVRQNASLPLGTSDRTGIY
jgi:hypothetical protein